MIANGFFRTKERVCEALLVLRRLQGRKATPVAASVFSQTLSRHFKIRGRRGLQVFSATYGKWTRERYLQRSVGEDGKAQYVLGEAGERLVRGQDLRDRLRWEEQPSTDLQLPHEFGLLEDKEVVTLLHHRNGCFEIKFDPLPWERKDLPILGSLTLADANLARQVAEAIIDTLRSSAS